MLGLVCATATAALGALILGEYEFTGTLPYVAGPLFGLAIGEVVVGVGRDRSVPVAVAAAVLGFTGVTGAAAFGVSEGVAPITTAAWVAAALAALVAGLRTVELRRREQVRAP